MSRYNDPSHVGFQSEREAAAVRNVSERARRINLALTRYLQAKPNAESATLTAADYDFVLRCYRSTVDDTIGAMYNWRVTPDGVTYRNVPIKRGYNR